MSMEKYGVDDVSAQQKSELNKVVSEIAKLSKAHEKTASDQDRLSRLEIRKGELEISIRSHKQ